ncbi:CPXCG motif-containing cysteine-rich protein [Puniceicoccus vermicola]|uniref:CPXCG motif-containing cysteine-rich protein n=1 Tax=Puniceicoccus vermicola TaxID=388746 RepID=A0A7X1AUZ8_9BACT|nr:CPXCG motif-containing cysteine-rich protein [Puniceicoccus vermicola]MBC2600359.1 CPXCG motif-containing cysteine-rich protein [Puniceicoccus vermicola]
MDASPYCEVTCPSCFETFSIPGPPPTEVPTEWDYDCEVCCRPMTIRFYEDDGQVFAEAESI